MEFYQRSLDSIITHFSTDKKKGLSEKQVAQLLQQKGLNILPEGKQESWLSVFIRQFQSPLIYILLLAAVIIFFVGPDKIDAFIISGILFFNAIIGTIQEGRTHNILQSLKRFIKNTCVVIRDDKKDIVENKYLVPGDLIIVQQGQRVPADARIIESNQLQVDESALTGESQGVDKVTQPITATVAVGEQKNMLFKGTYILSGSGTAVVVTTGIDTEFGKIHTVLAEDQTDLPLQREIEKLSYLILLFILAMCVFMFVLGAFLGKPIQELLVMLTALFICVVPEGLPVVLTLVLVTGVYRMAKQKVLVKNMQAVEALGRADVIVIDKTGTLTRNEMVVTQVFTGKNMWAVSGQGYFVEGEVTTDDNKEPQHDNDLVLMGHASALLSSSEITFLPEANLFDIKGDPTNAGMYVFTQKLGLTKEALAKDYTKLYEIPFDSRWKYNAGFFNNNGQGIIFVLGAPETIVSCSNNVDESVRTTFSSMVDSGLRVIGAATKVFDVSMVPQGEQAQKEFFTQLIDSNMQFLGFFGMQDSIRPEVSDLVRQARDAGISVVMATGDHKKTACYVASKVGMFSEHDLVVDGSEFHELSDEQLLKKLDHITVFSRVSPQDKLRIVELFHKQNKIVAMTGDGINDAPSLVTADLGIAMGKIGTEVAKEAADIILLDDSFENIINAVEQGRHIFYSLKRVILYFFATNMGEILIVLFALMANLPLPITAAQILWLNFVTDGFLDSALSMEPKEPGLLQKSWLQEKTGLIDKQLVAKMMFMAIPMGLGSLWMFTQYYQKDLAHARTITLITMAMFQWFNAWSCRSSTQSVFQLGLFTNKWLIAATIFVLALQVALLHVPFMQKIFKTVPITLEQWGSIVLLTSSLFIIDELRKWFVRYRKSRA